MAGSHQRGYISDMSHHNDIPAYALFGEALPFPDIIHIEPFSARAPRNDWHIAAHRHDQMSQLFMVETGQIDCVVDGATTAISAGEHLYLPERCVHGFDFTPGTIGNVFSFPLNVVRTVSPTTPGFTAALSSPIQGQSDKAFRNITALIEDAANTESAFRSQRVIGLVHAALAHLADKVAATAGAATRERSERLSRLDALISMNMHRNWSAREYADALSISAGHLSRLCRSATGSGAAGYIEQRIMQEACRLLAFTQLAVSQVAYRTGYSDPSHFSKRFRLSQGQSPTDYRRMFSAR